MTIKTSAERITFHDAIVTMEVDFASMTFADVAQVDAIYDEIERLSLIHISFFRL